MCRFSRTVIYRCWKTLARGIFFTLFQVFIILQEEPCPPMCERKYSLLGKKRFPYSRDDSYGEARYGEKASLLCRRRSMKARALFTSGLSARCFFGYAPRLHSASRSAEECYIQTGALRQGQVSSSSSSLWRLMKQAISQKRSRGARSILSVRMDSSIHLLFTPFSRFPVFRPEGGCFSGFLREMPKEALLCCSCFLQGGLCF